MKRFMSKEEYFNEFIVFMTNHYESKKRWIDYYYSYIPDLSLYNEVKSYIMNLYLKEIDKCENDISAEEFLAFDEIWAEILKITFDYCKRLNKKKRPAVIREIQRYMVYCYAHVMFKKQDIKDGGVTSEVIRIYISPNNSKRRNYISVDWANFYDSVQSIIYAKECIERTMKLTNNDLSFPCYN